ncbi:MAG TPA: response regulator transcription factor [Acidimicrobiales bacterium]
MKIIVCDDHVLLAESLVDALHTSGHEIVACLSEPRQIAPILRARHVDACLLDVTYPADNGLQHIAEMRRLAPSIRVVVLTGHSDAYRDVAMEAGADAFLSKGCSVDELLSVLQADQPDTASAGSTSRAASQRPSRGIPPLTEREQQVLQALVDGQSNAAIARRYGLRPSTVRSHVQNVFDKLGVHTRVAAVAFSIRHGLVSAPPANPRTPSSPALDTLP